MTKRSKLLGSIVVATVLLSANPASAQNGNPAYHTTFYSDSSHSTQVGYLIWSGCDRWNNPQYELVDSYSYYTEDELIGYCVDGEMAPL
jgi:hypothetical protein